MAVYNEEAFFISQTIHSNRILAGIDDEWTYDAAHVCGCWDNPEAHIPHHSGKELSEKHINEAECSSDANLSTQGEHLHHDLHVWGEKTTTVITQGRVSHFCRWQIVKWAHTFRNQLDDQKDDPT